MLACAREVCDMWKIEGGQVRKVESGVMTKLHVKEKRCIWVVLTQKEY